MTLEPLNPELLSAYLDDELAPEERREVELRLASDPAAQELLDELRGVRRSLASLPTHKLPADFAEQVLSRAERAMLARGASSGGSPSGAGSRGGELAADGDLASGGDRARGAERHDGRASAFSAGAAGLDRAIDAATHGDARSAAARPSERKATIATVRDPQSHRRPGDAAAGDAAARGWLGRARRPLAWSALAVAVALVVAFVGEGPTSRETALAPSGAPESMLRDRAAPAGGRGEDRAETLEFKAGPPPDDESGHHLEWRSADTEHDALGAPVPAAGLAGAAPSLSTMTTTDAAAAAALTLDDSDWRDVLIVQCDITPRAVGEQLILRLFETEAIRLDDTALVLARRPLERWTQTVLPDLLAKDAPESEATDARAAGDAPARRLRARSPAAADTAATEKDFAAEEGDADGAGDESLAELRAGDVEAIYVEASGEQIEAIVARLNSATDEVANLIVEPAPEDSSQAEWAASYTRGPRSVRHDKAGFSHAAEFMVRNRLTDEVPAAAAPPAGDAEERLVHEQLMLLRQQLQLAPQQPRQMLMRSEAGGLTQRYLIPLEAVLGDDAPAGAAPVVVAPIEGAAPADAAPLYVMPIETPRQQVRAVAPAAARDAVPDAAPEESPLSLPRSREARPLAEESSPPLRALFLFRVLPGDGAPSGATRPRGETEPAPAE